MTATPVVTSPATGLSVQDTLGTPDIENMTALVVIVADTGTAPGLVRSMLTHAKGWVSTAERSGSDAITFNRNEVQTPEYMLLEKTLRQLKRKQRQRGQPLIGGTTVIEALLRFLLGDKARETGLDLVTTRKGGRVHGKLALVPR
jgi:hypothetical protein